MGQLEPLPDGQQDQYCRQGLQHDRVPRQASSDGLEKPHDAPDRDDRAAGIGRN